MSDPAKSKGLKQLGLFQVPIVLTALIWVMFVVDYLLPWNAHVSLGLVPRTGGGAWGIVGMPLTHGDWAHLIANTVPLLILTTLLALTGKGWGTVGGITLLSGLLLWTFGRGGVAHVGASGLIYGLALYIIVRGIVERRLVLILVSLLVAVVYGGILFAGVDPTQKHVSWDGHLTGGVAGALVAINGRKKKPAEKR